MKPLPIVHRELLVASRRSSTYWIRFGITLGAVALWFVVVLQAQGNPLTPPGQRVLNALSILAFVFCALAGVFLTSDSIAEERREGTLGLIFLTHLKPHDVLLGKLASSSLCAFLGLVALMPVLALPLLIGGVTAAQVAWMNVALGATLLWSLSLGLLASVLARDPRSALGLTLVLVIVFCAVIPLAGFIEKTFTSFSILSTFITPLSPFSLLRNALLFPLVPTGTAFGVGLAAITGLALLSFAAAQIILPRLIQSDAAGGTGANLGGTKTMDVRCRLPLARPAHLDSNPYVWVALRESASGKALHFVLWLGVGLWVCLFFLGLASGEQIPAFIAQFFTTLAMHLLVKILLAAEAARHLNEERRSGALELLLATPLPPGNILMGIDQALRTRFRRAGRVLVTMNVMLLLQAIFFADSLDIDGEALGMFATVFLGGALIWFADQRALIWTGMLNGIKRKHLTATAVTVLSVLVPPWGVVLLFAPAFFSATASNEAFIVAVLFWFFLCLILDLALASGSRTILRTQFRALLVGDDARYQRMYCNWHASGESATGR